MLKNCPYIEQEYVQNTYNAIAEHFSATRGYHWECVKDFLDKIDSFKPQTVFEVGCGNGKNFLYTVGKNITFSGCDISQRMVEIAQKNVYKITGSTPTIFQADICNGLNIDTDFFDYTMCIAVIHHLSTFERRLKAIKELVRITKSNGGQVLLTTWCSQDSNTSQDTFKKWELQPRYNNECKNSEVKKYKRYYHLFCEDEMIDLLNQIDGINWVMYLEHNNWIAILTKK